VERAEDARLIALRKEAAEQQQQILDANNQAQVDAAQSQAEAAQAQARAQQSQMQAAQAQAAADRAAAAKAQADAQRARAEADAANARAQAAEANKSAQNAQQDAAAVREKLRIQLNAILATSESARGLIVNMSDVLFDTGKYTLKQGTQVSLAKVSGILQAYPGLKLQVEGYTDSVGGDDYNQKLSENRAAAVRDFLVSQQVSMNNISAMGFGKSDPVADNGTAVGRAQNRRVQLVVSGDAIGIMQQSGPEGGMAASATLR
jgi:outer membrane protein OmpA-like peptidoglycan-associated protein